MIETTHTQTTQNKLTEEEEMITENLKRIMSGKKTRLSSLRNQSKEELKKKINELLTHI